MFELDTDNRITFAEIRKHPIFAKHFPEVKQASTILYSKKFQPSGIYKKTVKVEKEKMKPSLPTTEE